MLKSKMTNFVIRLVLLILFINANGVHSQSTQDEPHHLNSTIRNFENSTHDYEDFLEIFSIHEIGLQWPQISDRLGSECSSDMTKYLKGLNQLEMWALKMYDATGRTPASYLWGNNYWMGSMTQCRDIYKSENEDFVKQKGNTGLGLIRKKETVMKRPHVNSPFVPRFGMLKVILTEAYTTPEPRTIYIGVCLPSSCDRDDFLLLAESGGKRVETKTVEIVNVRFPSQDGYSIFTDPTFLVFLGVTIIVVALLAAGSAYDIYLKRSSKEEFKGKTYIKQTHHDLFGTNGVSCDTPRADGDENIFNESSASPGNNFDRNLPIEQMMVETGKLSLAEEILLSFSVPANFEAICSKEVGEDTVSCLHGLKTVSMLWIILGHTGMVGLLYSGNKEFLKIASQQFVFQTVVNSVYAVDTYFFISGFLVSFLYLRNNAKGNLKKLSKGFNEFTSQSIHLLGLMSYRILRLALPYLYMIATTLVFMQYYASNSAFDPPTLDHINCARYWWRNLLYINTFYPVQDMCMIWSWYLSNDTQFFMLGAIFLIIGVKHFKFSAFCLSLFMVVAWITTAFIEYTNDLEDHFEFFDKIYDKPWTRFGPYLVGMLVGYYLFKTNFKIQLSRVQVITGWTIALSTLFALVYGVYIFEMNKAVAAAHSALSHTVWAVGVAWVVIACSTGNGGYINGLLSAKCLYPFSRVSYCVYLVHPLTIRAFALNADGPGHLDEVATFIIFLGQIGASYSLSFIVSLAFEAPVCALLRVLSKRSNTKS